MATFTVSPMKSVASITGAMELDTDALPTKTIEAFLTQGAKYYLDARYSHALAKLRAAKGKEGEDGFQPEDKSRELDADGVREIFAKVREDFHSEDFGERERAAVAPADTAGKLWETLLQVPFEKAGVLKRKSKNVAESVTVRSLVAQHGSPEAAYRAVATAWLSAGKGSPESVAPRVDKGWKALQATHATQLAALQAAAPDEDAVL